MYVSGGAGQNVGEDVGGDVDVGEGQVVGVVRVERVSVVVLVWVKVGDVRDDVGI